MQSAFRLSPLLFQRPGEIRQMLWSDVDLVAREWRPYISKTDFHHIVPLSTQAVTILEAIQPLTGNGQYVFPSSRGDGRPMSDNTIRTALKSLGYDSDVMTAHGFRTTASTLLNEQGWSPDAIEIGPCTKGSSQSRLQSRPISRRTSTHDASLGRLPGQPESRGASDTVSQGCIIVQHRPVRYYHECNSL